MAWTSLCQLDELKEGCGKYVEVGRFQLALFLHEGKPHVMDNYCPHAGGNLAGGIIEDGCAICPWHAWAFQLDNGQLRDCPAVTVTTYPTRLLERDHLPPLVQADLPL
ncbi:MAG TPA: Rieske (2Fe-2S) protein [Tepidisphaeraceae bacterium]|jgi:nitrite reductase/ring-hydroxylating ferredoxin subunit|nr:Rieske (2Fe-2S) protein [Tepidisphaeraceae bacterium]